MLADMQMWPRTSRSSCLECEPGPYCLLYVHVTRHVSVTSTGSTVYSESQQSAPYTYFICWDQIYLCTAQYGALKQQTNLNFFGAIQRPSSSQFFCLRGALACGVRKMLSKAWTLGSVGNASAGEGGGKSVPCSSGLMSASLSPSFWSRSGRLKTANRQMASGPAVRSSGERR